MEILCEGLTDFVIFLKGGISGRMTWQFLNALELFFP